MSFDLLSYIMGKHKGGGNVEINGDSQYEFVDKNDDGNIEVRVKEGVE